MTMGISKQTSEIVALWLIPGLGPHRIGSLLRQFGDSGGVFGASAAELTRVEGISSRLSALIQSARESPLFIQECRLIEKYRITVPSILDARYPKLLREIYTSPPILYVKGDIDFNRGVFIGVVGSRKASYTGKCFCKKLIRGLARFSSEITIVSGLALGIDGVAHRSALENGLKTVAVLAGGLSRIYPSQHLELSRSITENGALTTEFPIETKPAPGNFPLRNRIISGMSQGVIVIEAGERSGALITAGYALEQNRELFAVPGQADSRYYRGTNRLIQRGQAKLVLEAEDVLEELQPVLVAEKKKRTKRESPSAKDPTADEMAILNKLEDKCLHRDALAAELDMPVRKLLAILTTMEIKGLVVGKAGSLFQRVDP